MARRDVGWRVDCLGDMGGFGDGKWSHMSDYYPQGIVNFGMQDAWKKAPDELRSVLGNAALEEQGLGRGLHHRPVAEMAYSSFNASRRPCRKSGKESWNRWLNEDGLPAGVAQNYPIPAKCRRRASWSTPLVGEQGRGALLPRGRWRCGCKTLSARRSCRPRRRYPPVAAAETRSMTARLPARRHASGRIRSLAGPGGPPHPANLASSWPLPAWARTVGYIDGQIAGFALVTSLGTDTMFRSKNVVSVPGFSF